MNTQRFRVSVLAAGLILAVAGHCADLSSSQMLIVPGVSVGPVRSDMTEQQVVSQLGKPNRKHGDALEYWDLGFSVILREEQVHIVLCIDTAGQDGPFKKAFSGHTKESIQIASSRDAVILTYGKPSATESLNDEGKGEVLRYRSLGLYFRLHHGKVDTIGVIFNNPKDSRGRSRQTGK
jgi:hypothetical protein